MLAGVESGLAEKDERFKESFSFFFGHALVEYYIGKRFVVRLAERRVDLDIVRSGYKLNKELNDDFDKRRSVDVIRIREVCLIVVIEIFEYVLRKKFYNFVDVDDLGKNVSISVYYVACRNLSFGELTYEKLYKRRHERIFVAHRVYKVSRRNDAVVAVVVFLEEVLRNFAYFDYIYSEFFDNVFSIDRFSADRELVIENKVDERVYVYVMIVSYIERDKRFGRYNLVVVALFCKQAGRNRLNELILVNVISDYVNHAEVIHQELHGLLEVDYRTVSEVLNYIVKFVGRYFGEVRANRRDKNGFSVLIAPSQVEKRVRIEISEECIDADAVYHLGQDLFNKIRIAHCRCKINVVGKRIVACKERNEFFYLFKLAELRKCIEFHIRLALGVRCSGVRGIEPRAVRVEQTCLVKFFDKGIVKVSGNIGRAYSRVDYCALVFRLKRVYEIHKRSGVDTVKERRSFFRGQRIENGRNRQGCKLILCKRIEFEKRNNSVASRGSYLIDKLNGGFARNRVVEYSGVEQRREIYIVIFHSVDQLFNVYVSHKRFVLFPGETESKNIFKLIRRKLRYDLGKSEFIELFLYIYARKVDKLGKIVRSLRHKHDHKIVYEVRILVHEDLEVVGIYFRLLDHQSEVILGHIGYNGVDQAVLEVRRDIIYVYVLVKFVGTNVVNEYVLNMEVLEMFRQELVHARIVTVQIFFRTDAENDFEFVDDAVGEEVIENFLREISYEFRNIDDLGHRIAQNLTYKARFIVFVFDALRYHAQNVVLGQSSRGQNPCNLVCREKNGKYTVFILESNRRSPCSPGRFFGCPRFLDGIGSSVGKYAYRQNTYYHEDSKHECDNSVA